MMSLDQIDKRILNRIQSDFPITSHPVQIALILFHQLQRHLRDMQNDCCNKRQRIKHLETLLALLMSHLLSLRLPPAKEHFACFLSRGDHDVSAYAKL